jgi:ribosome-associated heat shock protein Hsp15
MSLGMVKDDDGGGDVRLDVWLDVACLYRTRSEAQKACKAGQVRANGQPARQNRKLHVDDEIELSRPFGRKQQIKVLALADRHVARAEARKLYEDVTPPPTADEIEMRRSERMFRLATPKKSPDKRQRQALRRLKGRD